MYIGPAQLVLNAFFGPDRTSAAQTNMFKTLSDKYAGTISAEGSQSYVSTLLDLSRTDVSGQSMFDVLSIENDARYAIFDALKKAGAI